MAGTIPFAGVVGKQYKVEYGLSVTANVTGAEGHAEVDFFNTGSVDLLPDDPLEGSFVVIPEPSSLVLLLTFFGALTAMGRRLII